MPICYLRTMGTPCSEDFYRQVHAGNPGDLEFYARLVNGREEVLELGCGWGRVTAFLAPRTRRIVGLEENSRFCEMARENLAAFPHATVLQHDVRTPLVNSGSRAGGTLGRFARIIAPYNLLYALGGERGAKSALEFVAAYLAPDGEFWCDVYPMDELQLALTDGEEPPEDDDAPVAQFEWEGRVYDVIEASTLNPSEQSLHVVYRAVSPSDATQSFFESSIEHHYLLLPQLERLFGDAGLEISLLLGGFDGRPYDEDAEQVVLCARRASGVRT